MHNYIRDPILALFMIFFHDIPILQVSSVVLVFLASAIMDTKHKPFLEKNMNLMMIIVGWIFVVINLGFCFLAFLNSQLEAKTRHTVFGNVLIFTIASVFVVEIAFTGIAAYYGFK
jgi:hypothetical protein